jgi:hypothetical protein
MQLFDPLVFAVHVEVVIAALPELGFFVFLQLSRCALFEHLDCDGQRGDARLADEKVNMLRHEDVSSDNEAILSSHALKLKFEDFVGSASRQQRLSQVATEGEKVKHAAVLIADKVFRHRKGILRWLDVGVSAFPPFARKKAKDGAPTGSVG